MIRVVVMLVIACASGTAHAALPTFSIEVTGPAWQAESLEKTLAIDLSGTQVRHAGAGTPADVRVQVAFAGTALTYVMTRAGVRPVHGAIALGSLDRRGLAIALADELHRMLPSEKLEERETDIVLAEDGTAGVIAILSLCVAGLAIPLVLARRLRASASRGARRCLLAGATLGVMALAVIAFGDRIPEATNVLVLNGGLAWGTFLAVVFPIALPPMPGLHRVEHHEIGRVVRAWLALAVQRSALVLLVLAPIVGVLVLAVVVLDVPAAIGFGILFPLVGLCARLVWRASVEVLAAGLDRELVDGDATAANPWHVQVRNYLAGYLRRANIDVDDELLDRMRFVPGIDPDGVAVYGGGLTHTRVVIGRAMLEHALAPYDRPHDFAMPRVSTLHWTHWNSGLVMATEAGETLATREDRDPGLHATVEEGEHERLALGEPPTFAGIVEPVAFDPRTSYRPDEDPLWLEWDPGEEFDGTDPGDRDFLFGALVLAIGAMQRHEDRSHTIAIAWRRWIAHRSFAQLAARFSRGLRQFAVARSVALADVHAALGGARHHVAQYVAWRLWRREELLTSRAYVPELEAASRDILAVLDRDAETADSDDALRTRIASLRTFLDHRPRPRSKRQRLAVAIAMVAGVAVAVTLVVQAVLYHSTYTERLKAQHAERRSSHGG